MLSWIREKFGRVVIGGIIASIALVFVFYGVFSPKNTRGLQEGAVAGTVDGEAISIAEFNRSLNQRLEFFKARFGDKISEEQLKSFRIKEDVFQELANRKMLSQEAKRQGLRASDEEVREKISEMKVFQKNDRFDLATYRQILESNGYTPTSFERLMREDLSVSQWDGYFKDRVHFSENELERQFRIEQDKRNIKYVILSEDSAKSAVAVTPEEIKKFFADQAQVNLAQMKFNEGANTVYKGQKFDAVKESIARTILAGGKQGELQKVNDALATQVVAAMKSDKGSDARVNALLKQANNQVKMTGLVSRQNPYIPGIGESKELLADAFAEKSPIAPGSQAKKYTLPGRILVAIVTEVQSPDMSKLGQQRDRLIRQVSATKGKELFDGMMKKVTAKTTLDANPAVVGELKPSEH